MSHVGFHDDAPVDELDQQLVAYLDGELPPHEHLALEKRLGTDASLRARLRELQNGWEMLDELPLASSSSLLLETTLRMAAVDGAVASKATPTKTAHPKLSPFVWLIAATAVCFGVGVALAQASEYLRYQKQLSDLPVAMHLDAFLNASDLALMKKLSQMPEWQQANELADDFGKWDVRLAQKIDATAPRSRPELITGLPIEDQKTIASAWERFERMDPVKRSAAYEIAERVAAEPNSEPLLQTMDRFAMWRETWPTEQRDQFAASSEQERELMLKSALDKTKKQWAQESGQKLSDEDVETVYHALRQIGRLRLKAVAHSAPSEVQSVISSFGTKDQSMDPQVEATFLRRLFDPSYPSYGNFVRRDGMSPPPMFSLFRDIAGTIRYPLREDELDWLEAVLPPKWSEFVNAASILPIDREVLLRSMAEEALRRTQWNRSGQTAAERYLKVGSEREEIDLLPTNELLRRLEGEGFGRR